MGPERRQSQQGKIARGGYSDVAGSPLMASHKSSTATGFDRTTAAPDPAPIIVFERGKRQQHNHWGGPDATARLAVRRIRPCRGRWRRRLRRSPPPRQPCRPAAKRRPVRGSGTLRPATTTFHATGSETGTDQSLEHSLGRGRHFHCP